MIGGLEILIGAVLAIIAAFFGGRWAGGVKERSKIERERAKSHAEQAESGRKAVSNGRASGLSPDERLRANDGKW